MGEVGFNRETMSRSPDLDFLLKATSGVCLKKKATVFSGVGSDSREDLKNRVFFALKGPHHNGHDFLSQAVSRGAVGLVVSEVKNLQDLSMTVIQVRDTLKALQDLALHWRRELKLKVIAVTGSNGKTTTKEFTKTLLSPLPVGSSPKSYNNHYGVPFSLLEVSRPKSFFVQELGVSGPGEMAPLCRICEPDISLVTTVTPAHLQGFKTLSRVAEEKKQIYLESRRADWVFYMDNPHTEKMYRELCPRSAGGRSLTCSQKRENSDVFLSISGQTEKGMEVRGVIGGVKGSGLLEFSGSHNVGNLACACGTALLCGVSPREIWDRMSLCQTPPGRQKRFTVPDREVSVVFDGYNANPASMEAFFNQFLSIPHSRRAFILGDMKELGEEAASYHRALANHPALKTAGMIWYIGDFGDELHQALKAQNHRGKFLWTKIYERDQMEDFKKNLQKGSAVGIKASRSLRLERALFDLTGQSIVF